MATDLLTPRYPALSAEDNIDGPLKLSPLVLGAAVFGFDYNTAGHLESDVPLETIKLAFKYGLRTLDTAPYYTTSEQVLGRVLTAIADEFPRESYQIVTKIGRYHKGDDGFDYSPSRTLSSVQTSLSLLNTTYLDAVYAHDVEFVAEAVGGAGADGALIGAIDENGAVKPEYLERWGLKPEDAGKIHGPGDQKVLDAIGTLFELKKQGLIKAVGMSGLPLPTLLRLARLIAFHLEPIDIVQSYCHHTLQNVALRSFVALYYEAGVKQIVSASPLSMGILRTAGGQAWHPASPDVKDGATEAKEVCAAAGVKLEDVALAYGFISAKPAEVEGRETPTLVGLSTPEEVHETMRIYSTYYGQDKEKRSGRLPGEGLKNAPKQLKLEKEISDIFRRNNSLNWTWQCGN